MSWDTVSLRRPGGIEGGAVIETGLKWKSGLENQFRRFDPVGSDHGWHLGSIKVRVEFHVDSQDLLPVGFCEIPDLGSSIFNPRPPHHFEDVFSKVVLLQVDGGLSFR